VETHSAPPSRPKFNGVGGDGALAWDPAPLGSPPDALRSQSSQSTAVVPQHSWPTAWFLFGVDILTRIMRFGFQFLGSLLPFSLWNPFASLQEIDPTTAAQLFQSKFEEQYGPLHPRFFIGSYSQALSQAKRQFKFLLIYLHSEYHHNTPIFCREALSNESLSEFLNENVILWVANINQTSEAYRVNNLLSVSTYPTLAVLRNLDNKPTLVHKFEGLIETDQLKMRLRTIMEAEAPYFQNARNQEEERIRNRRLLEEQDVAFLQSLAVDQEKERKAREEEQKKLEVERALREAEEKKRQQLERKKIALPVEPALGSEGVVHIVVKLPSGDRISRRFHKHNKLQDISDFVDLNQKEIESGSFYLASPYPRKLYTDPNLTLQDAGFSSQALLHVSLASQSLGE